jgi:hypothetical protein
MRLGVVGARVAVLAAALLSSTTCQVTDLLKPAGLERIALTYASDSVLVVGDTTRASVTVKVNGATSEGARLQFESSNSDMVEADGDVLVPKQRGTVTLTVSLVGSTLPRSAPSLTQKLLVVADTVTVDSASVRLASLGDTVTLAATARDALGAAIAGATAHWSSSDTNAVTVTPAGRLAAKANGTTTVRAMVDRDTALVPVTVTQVLTKWTFEPASLRIDALTATGSAVATGHDARGNAIAALAPATWTIGDATIASVAADGSITALKNGATWLFAARGAIRDSVAVTVAQRATLVAVNPKPAPPVTSLGGQVQLTARAFDRKAVEIQGVAPSWLTLDPTLARVGSDGLVTALGTGTAHIVAALDQGADTVSVVISNDPASITVAPDSALATSVGDTLVFRAVARNGRGDSVAATFTWRTPDSTIVKLLSDGRVIALAVGTARAIATVGSKADTGLAKVTNVPTLIDITPASRAYTSLGDIDTLLVTITNARGATLPRGAVTWASDEPLIARVTSAGIVTARDTGETVVRATSGAVTDSVRVTVQNLPASIVIGGPPVDTLTAIGQTLTLAVDVRNARGAPILNYPVAWRSANRLAVDTVRPTGEAQAVGWGTTRLIAAAGAAADTVDLAVQNPTRLYVNNAFFPAPRVGTMARPYARIQNAVDAAEAGDTVIVLRGLGRYSESVNLVRRIVLLGDQASFERSGRNFDSLPFISHDTGAYAIRAHTTAPVTIKYLAISHTLDGPALDADGSNVELAWVTVNPPGTVTSPIGRGFSIANSNAGSSVYLVRVYNVSGYGIRLYRVNGAILDRDSVDTVVPGADGSDGSGIRATGGTVSVSASFVRRTAGPMIHVDSTSNLVVSNSDLAGLQRMVRAVDVGITVINWNSLRIVTGPNENAQISYPDSLEMAVIEFIRPHGQESITDNTFTAEIRPCSPVWCAGDYPPRDFIAVQDRVGVNATNVGRNRFHGPGRVLLSRNSKTSMYDNHADSVTTFFEAAGNDIFWSEGDTVDASLNPCILARLEPWGVSPSGGQYSLSHAALKRCALYSGPGAIDVATSTSSTWLTLTSVRVTGLPAAVAGLRLQNGGALTVDSSAFEGGTGAGPVNAACNALTPCAGVRAEAYNVQITNSVITGFHTLPGLSVDHTTLLTLQNDAMHDNRFGLEIGADVAPILAAKATDVFDNDSAGLRYLGAAALTLPDSIWWGDGRGPRGPAYPIAAGDSIASVGGGAIILNPGLAPSHVGSQPAALRAVRGDAQTAAAGAILMKALTVRVVDAAGLPVAGVSVQFSVTGGGGSFGGPGNVTVTTNASGLAEAVLTLGSSPGTNTVKVSAGGVQDLSLTATGT